MSVKIIFIGILCVLAIMLVILLSRVRRLKKTAQMKHSIKPIQEPPEVEEFVGDNRCDTELDLAKAYLELHYSEKAKSLLKSVITQGNQEQIIEARKMFTLLLKQERESKPRIST